MKQHGVDFILSPNAFGASPPRILEVEESGYKNPISEYKLDYFTALTNALGVPALTMPLKEKESDYKFPASIRLQGYFGEDYHLLRIANKIESLIKDNHMNAF